MKFRYALGLIFAQVYRTIKVFPNSDPIMGFVLPAAKNEPFWKAPLFAFTAMVTFDIFTSGIGIWTLVTSATYALIALAFTIYFRNRRAGLGPYMKAGAAGVLAFDFVTGPAMSTFMFGQPFLLTLLMQVPFTAMHLVSATFGIFLITPLLDIRVAEEISGHLNAMKRQLPSRRIDL